MTEENKNLTLDYLVGNISNTPSDNNFRAIKQGTKANFGDLLIQYQTVQVKAGELQIYNYRSLAYKNYTIIWQYFYNTSNSGTTTTYNYQTVIILLDSYMNELNHWVIPYGLVDLQVDEDGNFYGMSSFTQLTQPTSRQNRYSKDARIILFNNPTVRINSTYELKIRKTYIIPYELYIHGESQETNTWSAIKKAPNSNSYYIVACYGEVGTTGTVIYRFTINVGSQNEWKKFTISIFGGCDPIINFREIDDKTECIIYYIGRGGSSVKHVQIWKIVDDDLSVVKQDNLTGISHKSISRDKIYVTGYLTLYYAMIDNDGNCVLGYYNNGTSSLTNAPSDLINVGFANSNGVVIMEYTCGSSWYGYASRLLLMNEASSKLLVGYSKIVSGFNLRGITYNNQYNLFNLLTQVLNSYTTEYYQFIYNPINYNGSSYISNESLIPQNIELTNDNLILFNRNLYNREIRNNTMTASVQIPNNLINEKAITNETLYSRTNFIMNDEKRQIEKNVYETLNLNFINTWNMININPNKNDINLIGASRLVKSITTNDTTGQIDNILIYFDKDTKILNKNQFTLTKIKNGRYVYGFNLTIPNTSSKLLSIQFRANDNTVYQTIQGNELNIKKGKTYYITQRVRVDNGQDRFIVYNGNKVTYDGKPLVY